MYKTSKVTSLLVVLILLSPLALNNAFGQGKFPSRPITFIINFPPGGTLDLGIRPLLDAASKFLGQPVVPVNKPGASGTLGPASLKSAKPDGYTLSLGNNNLLSVYQMQNVDFDPFKDFTYLMRIMGGTYGIVVRSDSPWRTLKDLVEYARQHPDEIKYSTSTPGGCQHFAMEDIANKEGIKWKIVPYPGSVQAITALLGGHVHVCSQDARWAPYVSQGQLRLLAVFGTQRVEEFPETPTLKELGYHPWSWSIGIVGPAGMDKGVVKILHDAFKQAMNDPVYLKTLKNTFQILDYANAEDYTRDMHENYVMIGDVLRMLGMQKK